MNKAKITMMCLAVTALTLGSCKKADEDNEIKLEIKSGAGYTSADQTLPTGSAFIIGVHATTEKKKDPLVKFNISEAVNGQGNTSIFSETIETQDYNHDHDFTLNDTVHGNKHKYTLTVTNKDGLNQNRIITITVQ